MFVMCSVRVELLHGERRRVVVRQAALLGLRGEAVAVTRGFETLALNVWEAVCCLWFDALMFDMCIFLGRKLTRASCTSKDRHNVIGNGMQLENAHGAPRKPITKITMIKCDSVSDHTHTQNTHTHTHVRHIENTSFDFKPHCIISVHLA